MKELLSEDSMISAETVKLSCFSVIDGGTLIHRVQWEKGMSFLEISQRYIDFVNRLHKNTIVVFDGYDISSTKDQEHLRRYSVPLSHFVDIRDDLPVPYSKEKYLSLRRNKAHFVRFLSSHFFRAGIDVINCVGDADTAIVKAAMTSAAKNQGPVQVIVDDTDIVVMLLYHFQENMDDIFMLQSQKS